MTAHDAEKADGEMPQRGEGLPLRGTRACSERPASGKLRVGFILVQPFTLTTFAGFIDALRLAADEDDSSRPIDCEWSIMGNSDEDIVSICGVPVRP